MFLVGLLSWWYGRGWIAQWRHVAERWMATVQFFSSASPAVAIRAFFDQLISRIIGAFVRFFTILAGVIVIILQVMYSIAIMALWWILPTLPVVGFILLAIGWVPSWI
jgi:hypothetical protein